MLMRMVTIAAFQLGMGVPSMISFTIALLVSQVNSVFLPIDYLTLSLTCQGCENHR